MTEARERGFFINLAITVCAASVFLIALFVLRSIEGLRYIHIDLIIKAFLRL
ncbi:hypothetical protein GX441_05575 [bacterium]|nr:hypothetical protein [bacterium]